MALKVAINGFGRIGRLALRLMHNDPEFDIVGINDLTDAKTLAHLLKYDSAQGRFDGEVEAKENSIVVNGKEIPIFADPNPENLPWGDLGVVVVFECTGFFNDKEKAEAHVKAGAKHVILSAPGSGDLKTVVYGVNHDILDGSETVISGASCTTNCLAPMVDVLNKEYGLVQGFMTTIHAYTNDQNTLDGPHSKNIRRGRAAAGSIVPNSTGAAAAIGLVIPELKGKLDGSAQRVPVITGSITEVVAVLEKDTTVDQINAAMKAAADGAAFGYTEDEIVSADIIGSTIASLFDGTQTRVIDVDGKQLVKIASFYDNEMGYTGNLVRTARHFGNLIQK